MNAVQENHYFYARQYAYDLLRRLFIEEPTVELLQYLQQDSKLDIFPFSDEDELLHAAVKRIRAYLTQNTFVSGQESFENLHWDFTRLFIGPEAPPAPPWESVYVSRDKLLFQESTNAVKQFYERAGFKMQTKEYEAADHIGYELDFMYHLSTNTLGHLNNADVHHNLLDLQIQFLNQHLLAFTEMFAQRIIQHADTEFYRSAATLLHHFLQHDKNYIESQKNLPR